MRYYFPDFGETAVQAGVCVMPSPIGWKRITPAEAAHIGLEACAEYAAECAVRLGRPELPAFEHGPWPRLIILLHDNGDEIGRFHVSLRVEQDFTAVLCAAPEAPKVCQCKPDCPTACHGNCGCVKCQEDYGDFLSSRD
jgi:hypothetical protein